VSVYSSRLPLPFAFAILCGCIGPWDATPSNDSPEIRAAVAVFIQAGHQANAHFSRPIDNPSEASLSVPWLDELHSEFFLEEPDRRSSIGTPPSDSLQFNLWSSEEEPNLTETSFYSFGWLDTAAADSIWIFRGHLRWNASSPLSIADPLWVTDSFDAVAERSTSPRFLRTGGMVGTLALRWNTLADADQTTRAEWAGDPDSLVKLVQEWTDLQASRNLDPRILAPDTTQHPAAYVWGHLDTTLLRRILDPLTVGGSVAAAVVFAANDTIWAPSDQPTWIQTSVFGTQGRDFYIAHQVAYERYYSSLAVATVSDWPGPPGVAMLLPSSSDSGSVAWYIQGTEWTGVRLELAVQGTCPSQMVWLHEGGSNRSQLPHGNVAPLDGFVCEVHTDTISFPLGQ